MTSATRSAESTPKDLRLPQVWRRVTATVTVVALVGSAMTTIVFANYGKLRAAAIAAGALAASVYFLGTAAYRLKVRGLGRIEAHSVLGLRRVDLTDGFSVRQARYGRAVVVVRLGWRRVRINGGLGRANEIEHWLQMALAHGEDQSHGNERQRGSSTKSTS